MFKKIMIEANQLGLLYKNKQFERVLTAGVYKLFDSRVQKVSATFNW